MVLFRSLVAVTIKLLKLSESFSVSAGFSLRKIF